MVESGRARQDSCLPWSKFPASAFLTPLPPQAPGTVPSLSMASPRGPDPVQGLAAHHMPKGRHSVLAKGALARLSSRGPSPRGVCPEYPFLQGALLAKACLILELPFHWPFPWVAALLEHVVTCSERGPCPSPTGSHLLGSLPTKGLNIKGGRTPFRTTSAQGRGDSKGTLRIVSDLHLLVDSGAPVQPLPFLGYAWQSCRRERVLPLPDSYQPQNPTRP